MTKKQSLNNKKQSASSEQADSIDIVKFPRTHHLFSTNKDVTRDDLVMDEKDAATDFYAPSLGPNVTLEEKVDGSNLGITLDVESYKLRCQNRSHYVTCQSHAQFKTLQMWLDEHSGELFSLLSDNNNGYILYGEWMYAKHSIYYDQLPDTFIAFDIYDKHAEKFVSVQLRNQLLANHAPTISVVQPLPMNGAPHLTKQVLLNLLENQQSLYCSNELNQPIEGVYVRVDEGNYLKTRSKVVRSDFIQAIDTHWSGQELVKNRIDFTLKYN